MFNNGRPIDVSLSSINQSKTSPFCNPPVIQKTTPPCPIDVTYSGTHLNVGKTFPNVIDNGPHHVDVNAYGKVPLGSHIPPGVGGGVQYRNDHGHGANLNVDHVLGQGTTVSGSGNLRLMESNDRTTRLDLSAGASQHYGRHGKGPVSGHVMLGLRKDF